MKQCPKCSKDYADDAGFCLQDGSPLVFVASNQFPPQNSGAPNIFAMPAASNAQSVNNPTPFQQNQNAPNIFAPPNNNAGFQHAAQPPNYQPVYQQTPMPTTNKNSSLRTLKKLLMLAGIPLVLTASSFFFRTGGIEKVHWFEYIGIGIGAVIIVGGLIVIEGLEKK